MVPGKLLSSDILSCMSTSFIAHHASMKQRLHRLGSFEQMQVAACDKNGECTKHELLILFWTPEKAAVPSYPWPIKGIKTI